MAFSIMPVAEKNETVHRLNGGVGAPGLDLDPVQC